MRIVAKACLRSIGLLRLRSVKLLLHAASRVCLALPVSFAAGRDVQSEKESDPRGSKAVHDIEDVIRFHATHDFRGAKAAAIPESQAAVEQLGKAINYARKDRR